MQIDFLLQKKKVFVENRVVAGNCVQVIGDGELSAY